MDAFNSTNITSEVLSDDVDIIQQIVTYACLCLMALVCVWVGAYRSVKLHQRQKESETESVDVLTTRDAALFPLFASGVLIGAYLVFVVVSKEYTSFLVTIYFFFVGTFAIYSFIEPVIRSLPESLAFYTYQLSLKEVLTGNRSKKDTQSNPLQTYEVTFDCRNLFGLLLAALASGTYASTKHWIANNLIGSALCVSTIQVLQINKFINGAILLSGLFVYDIFWVFGTNVMVSVAKNFDAPIKLTVPRQIFSRNAFVLRATQKMEYSMLGLGDIIVPGIYIALLLRFEKHHNKRSSLHFYVAFTFYVISLIITVMVVHVFHKAQPALLYIVPLMLIPTSMLTTLRGEWKQLLAYNDHEEKTDVSEEQVPIDAKKED